MAWGFEIPNDPAYGGGGGSSADLSRITDLFRTLGNPARTTGISGQGGMTPNDWWRALTPYHQAVLHQQRSQGSPATPTHPSVSTQYATPFGVYGVGPGGQSGSPSGGPPDLGPVNPSTLPGFTPSASTGSPSVQGADPGGGKTPGQKGLGIASILAPFLVALFGNNPYKGQAASSADQLAQLAKSLGGEGHEIAGQGLSALGPVMQYLTALAGGDPQALANATQPERARVLDQYDSARKALQFLPRGGGQAGAAMQAGSKAARDIGPITADARRSAVGTLGGLGKGLLEEGLTEERYATDALTQVITAYLSLSQQQAAGLGGLGSAIGTALFDAALFAL